MTSLTQILKKYPWTSELLEQASLKQRVFPPDPIKAVNLAEKEKQTAYSYLYAIDIIKDQIEELTHDIKRIEATIPLIRSHLAELRSFESRLDEALTALRAHEKYKRTKAILQYSELHAKYRKLLELQQRAVYSEQPTVLSHLKTADAVLSLLSSHLKELSKMEKPAPQQGQPQQKPQKKKEEAEVVEITPMEESPQMV